MCRVIVWDGPEHKLLGLLSRYDLYIAAPESGHCDILAIGPAPVPGPMPCVCRVAVAPESLPPDFWQSIQAERVITYGLQAQNTLTLSSLDEPWVLALQRELVTIGGRRVEQQEIILAPKVSPPPASASLPVESLPPLDSPELALCASGVALAAGIHAPGLFC